MFTAAAMSRIDVPIKALAAQSALRLFSKTFRACFFGGPGRAFMGLGTSKPASSLILCSNEFFSDDIRWNFRFGLTRVAQGQQVAVTLYFYQLFVLCITRRHLSTVTLSKARETA